MLCLALHIKREGDGRCQDDGELGTLWYFTCYGNGRRIGIFTSQCTAEGHQGSLGSDGGC